MNRLAFSLRSTPLFLTLAIPVAATNLIAWLSGITLPWLNLDFLLATWVVSMCIGCPKAYWLVAPPILIVAFGAQVGRFVSQIFGLDLTLVAQAFQFFSEWPRRSVAVVTVTIVIYTVGACYLCRTRPGISLGVKLTAAVLVLVIVADVVAGRSPFFTKDVSRTPNLVTSPLVAMARAVRQLTRGATPPENWYPAPPSYQALRVASAHGSNPFVLSVGFESLGLPKDARFRLLLDRMVQKAFPGYILKAETELFWGSTFQGELRALCGLRPLGAIAAGDAATTRQLDTHCWPKKLFSTGWRTLGAHGNVSTFYRRHSFYPLLGFSQTIFKDAFASDSDRSELCSGVWDAVCDRAVAARIMRWAEAETSRPSFAHFMTIDTHFPLSGNGDLGGAADCAVGTPEPLCLYFQKVEQSLSAIGGAIAAARRQPDSIVIWGDHSPPWLTKDLRRRFSEKSVPVWVLSKK